MKIFVVGEKRLNKLDIANTIVSKNDDLNICKSFTTEQNPGMIGEYMFCLDEEEIILSFRNNVLLYIDYSDKHITGITIDDFNMSDIIPIDIKHFNSIPDYLIENEELLILWIDSKNKEISSDKKYVIEAKYLQERVDNLNFPMMYFLDENLDDIANLAIEYMNSNEENREILVQENS